MIPFLSPLKHSVWLKISFLCFFSGLATMGLWIFANEYTQLKQEYILAFIGAVIFLISLTLGKIIAEFALKPTDFIARAVLITTDTNGSIEPPETRKLAGPSNKFIAELINRIYSLPGNDKTDVNGGELLYYKTIASMLPLPIITLNAQQKITFANEAALAYAQLPANEVINKIFYDTFNISFSTEDTLDKWISEIGEKSAVAAETWQRVHLNLPTGKTKQFDLVAHYSQNDPTGIEVIITMYDRTRLYERDDHELTFVALAVHELRTPVTILRGYIEVFEDELGDKLDSEQLSFMRNMSASAQQLTSFVSNILNVARVEDNALTLQLKEDNWPAVLKQICKDMDLRAKVHGKKLVVNIADNLPTVAVDKVSIYEVVSNLIENAIKYTHTDEEIVIATYLKDGQIETTITDKGVGVPTSILPHIFDKFYRSYSSKNSVSGTGLGLYLAKAIVSAHGGDIWVKSKEGQGSTFGFTLQIFSNIKDDLASQGDGGIVRGAHGWIKNHSLYRG
jgi:signal transduction histidine kinase